MIVKKEKLPSLTNEGRKAYLVVKLLNENGMKAWDEDYRTISPAINSLYHRKKFNDMKAIMIIGKRHCFFQLIKDEFTNNGELREVIGLLDIIKSKLHVYNGEKLFMKYEGVLKSIDDIFGNALEITIKPEEWNVLVNRHGDWFAFDYD